MGHKLTWGRMLTRIFYVDKAVLVDVIQHHFEACKQLTVKANHTKIQPPHDGVSFKPVSPSVCKIPSWYSGGPILAC